MLVHCLLNCIALMLPDSFVQCLAKSNSHKLSLIPRMLLAIWIATAESMTRLLSFVVTTRLSSLLSCM